MSLVENLRYKFDDFQIDIRRWEISDNGITALWGPSGAGKTTVFRLLLGLEPCPELSWIFLGKNLAALATPERKLGVVFQGYELFPHLSARDNIMFAARARKRERTLAENDLKKWSEVLELQDQLDKPAAVLSGGEKQRVALARALMGEPCFVFLDEPFSALDQELREKSRNLIKEVVELAKVPTLLITHDESDLSIAHTLVRIENGSIKEEKGIS